MLLSRNKSIDTFWLKKVSYQGLYVNSFSYGAGYPLNKASDKRCYQENTHFSAKAYVMGTLEVPQLGASNEYH